MAEAKDETRGKALKEITDMLKNAFSEIPAVNLRGDGVFVFNNGTPAGNYELLRGMHNGRDLVRRIECLVKTLP